MAARRRLYDTSDYSKDHSLHCTMNKKVLGKMEDECAGRPIAEYVGLRPKMYSILEASGENIKKANGVHLLGSWMAAILDFRYFNKPKPNYS